MCEHIESTARPGKRSREKRNVGRPSKGSTQSLIKSIRDLVHSAIPVPSSKGQYLDEQQRLSHIQCSVCLDVLSLPVELGCNNLVCADCCCKWIEITGNTECPVCYTHKLSEDEISKPPPVVTQILAELKIRCNRCNNLTTASQFNAHLSSNCNQYTAISSPSLEDILSAPGTAPTLPVERRVAEKLVRRLLAESEDNTITISTGGQVRHKITEQLLM